MNDYSKNWSDFSFEWSAEADPAWRDDLYSAAMAARLRNDHRRNWAMTRRVSPWPVLRLALLVALIAFLLGVLAVSALVSTRQVDMVAPAPNETTNAIMPGPEASAVRATNTPSAEVSRAGNRFGPQYAGEGDAVMALQDRREGASTTLPRVTVSGLTTGDGPLSDGSASAASVVARTTPIARGHASEDDRMSLLPVEEKAAGSTPAGGAVEAIIRNAALRWGVDPDRMVRVARCESSLNPNAIGDQGRAVGLFQFHAETFFRMAAPLGILEDLRTDPVVSANVAARAFSMGRAGEWTCAR